MKVRDIALISNLTAASVVLRLVKHVFIGVLPIINFPIVFALISGALFGPIYGFLVGFLSFIVSDVFLGMGIWTIITSFSCGFIGLIGGFIWYKRNPCRWELLVLSMIMIFVYDVISSVLLYLTLMPLKEAFIVGLIGLFMPIMGGKLYMVGPVVEFSSAMLISILLPKLRGILNG
ncbi:MAG: ECF transporter S component [Candidatus Methanomethylicia archaeon]|nr:ECF transporter S component [Candidatus Methanomethylicia archaeon]